MKCVKYRVRFCRCALRHLQRPHEPWTRGGEAARAEVDVALRQVPEDIARHRAGHRDGKHAGPHDFDASEQEWGQDKCMVLFVELLSSLSD